MHRTFCEYFPSKHSWFRRNQAHRAVGPEALCCYKATGLSRLRFPPPPPANMFVPSVEVEESTRVFLPGNLSCMGCSAFIAWLVLNTDAQPGVGTVLCVPLGAQVMA